eukprot:symbB.v1.2.017101.t1/scaffold1326.1/size125234/2
MQVLAEYALEEGLSPEEAPQFVHLDPHKLFEPNEGKITTPQHTDALYQQLATLQIGFARQSGCLSMWWNCSRFKTAQRLVNMMSVGIPSIIWADARGHLDVVEGLWPHEAKAGCRDETGMPEQCYPKEIGNPPTTEYCKSPHNLLFNAAKSG